MTSTVCAPACGTKIKFKMDMQNDEDIKNIKERMDECERKLVFVGNVMTKLLEKEIQRDPGRIAEDVSGPALMPDAADRD